MRKRTRRGIVNVHMILTLPIILSRLKYLLNHAYMHLYRAIHLSMYLGHIAGNRKTRVHIVTITKDNIYTSVHQYTLQRTI